MSKRDLTAYRGRTIAMIFQEPGLALDPVYRVGDQTSRWQARRLSDPDPEDRGSGH